MLYKLLGMAVWRIGKLFLRRRYGPTYTPKPVLAAGGLLVAGLVVALLLRRDGSDA
jgi:hypothetical protein